MTDRTCHDGKACQQHDKTVCLHACAVRVQPAVALVNAFTTTLEVIGRHHATETQSQQEEAFNAGYAMGTRDGAILANDGIGLRWIAMQERTPSVNQTCLVFSISSGSPQIRVDRWSEDSSSPVPALGGALYNGCSWDDDFYGEVTHWMPLPPPPVDGP